MPSSKSRPPIPPKALRDVWAKVPSIECKGKCANSCGPISCSSQEQKLMEDRAGHALDTDSNMHCTMLKHGRCSVYSARPVICRLWGVVPSMPCPWGCKPERMLTDREGLSLMLEAMDLAGDDPDGKYQEFLDNMPEDAIAKMREWALGAPDLGGAIRNRRKARNEFEESLRQVR